MPDGNEPFGAELAVAEALLRLPTAPLHEDQPIAHVLASVARRPGLVASLDAAGNVLVRYDGDGSDPDRPLVLVTHLDHPGFTVEDAGDGMVSLAFRGGLAADVARPGAPIDLFGPQGPDPVARARLVATEHAGSRLTAATARLTGGDPAAARFATWGLTPVTLAQGLVAAPACDDLLGAAAVLCTLGALAQRPPAPVAVWGLFTRAEEIGLRGALEAIRLATVPRGATVVSLERSRALPGAAPGDGVVVGVGDRTTAFDLGLTQALWAAAARVAARDRGFSYRRRLMDGGTCEASAFCASGFRASGLALPLGNYHNARDDGAVEGAEGDFGLAPEVVAVDDYLALVQLLGELARSPAALDGEAAEAPRWLTDGAAAARATLGAG